MEAALATLTLAELQTRLTAALDAAHQLYIGVQEVTVREGPSLVTYREPDIGKLEAYIAALQGAITAKQSGAPAGRRPVYIEL